ncbi:hypothetical protein CB1_000113015 [Camelus ferus]|nr:hypothetical protein CB1_000113015 [Camelus ferus]
MCPSPWAYAPLSQREWEGAHLEHLGPEKGRGVSSERNPDLEAQCSGATEAARGPEAGGAPPRLQDACRPLLQPGSWVSQREKGASHDFSSRLECFFVRSHSIFDNNRQDPTGLTAALQATDLAGVLHMLYCVLFHGTVSDPGATSPKESYAQNTVQVAIQSLRFFNSFAALDLPAFQSIIGAEGLSLAFRHIASSLLGHCSQVSCESLLHEVIVCVGYFTVSHPDNQVIVQSGRHPTVLQKLCQLPFQYFSDPRLIKVLFPSLIAACYNNPQNKIILEQEMSCVLLATFIQLRGMDSDC